MHSFHCWIDEGDHYFDDALNFIGWCMQDELAANVTLEQGKTLPDARGDVFRGLGGVCLHHDWIVPPKSGNVSALCVH